MLVLTRKPNQQLKIGSDIVITVVKVRGNTIRLGIEAPRDVRVVRSELDAKPQADVTAEPHADSSIEAAAPPANDDQAPATPTASVDQLSKNPLLKSQSPKAQAPQERTPHAQPSKNRPQGTKRPPLKPFVSGNQARSRQPGRDLEDSPLCHAGQSSQRTASGLLALQR